MPPDLDALNGLHGGTMGEATGMEFVGAGDDWLRMRMPVDERTRQPMGLLHGGASAALAETIGSVASTLCIDLEAGEAAVGLELNCSHLRGVREGFVYATCRPVRIGRTVHVWEVRIADEGEKPVCVCRLTVSVVRRGAARASNQ